MCNRGANGRSLIKLSLAMHYWNNHFCRVCGRLGKAKKNLGKRCTECCTRQTTLGNSSTGKQGFTECQNAGMSADVLLTGLLQHSAQKRTSRPSTAQRPSCLCRVPAANSRQSRRTEKRHVGRPSTSASNLCRVSPIFLCRHMLFCRVPSLSGKKCLHRR